MFTIVAVLVWYATLRSGLHATLAGVALGRGGASSGSRAGRRPGRWSDSHPWSSYVIVPLFALANAGVALGGGQVEDALGSGVAIGVVLGLVVGKTIGVTGAAALAIRTGLGRRPEGTGSLHLLGIGIVAGIGFTMSLFVTLLAFDSAVLVDEAKIGVFAALDPGRDGRSHDALVRRSARGGRRHRPVRRARWCRAAASSRARRGAGHRLELDGHRVHRVDDRLEAELNAARAVVRKWMSERFSASITVYPPQSPTRTTNWWNVMPFGVSHWRKTSRMRVCAASYSAGPAAGRSSQRRTYFW